MLPVPPELGTGWVSTNRGCPSPFSPSIFMPPMPLVPRYFEKRQLLPSSPRPRPPPTTHLPHHQLSPSQAYRTSRMCEQRKPWRPGLSHESHAMLPMHTRLARPQGPHGTGAPTATPSFPRAAKLLIRPQRRTQAPTHKLCSPSAAPRHLAPLAQFALSLQLHRRTRLA